MTAYMSVSVGVPVMCHSLPVTSITPSCGGKATRRKFSCASPPPKHGQISKCHKIFLDTVLKIIFSKTNIPGSKCVTCSSFMDIQYLKYLKISHKMVKNHFKKIKNYWKCVLI